VSSGCCGWDKGNIGKDEVGFEYEMKGFLYAQGSLPTSELTGEFILKLAGKTI